LGTYVADGTRVINEMAGLSVSPDGCYFTNAAYDAGRVTLESPWDGGGFLELAGSPEMVLEIVNPSNVRKDRTLLRKLYHLAGIQEYWLVDARRELMALTIYRSTRSRYEAVPSVDGWIRSALFHREFCLDRVRNPIGLWQYTLHVRPFK
jgi:Uma2 family endonuclease